jgi:hypothetical protein
MRVVSILLLNLYAVYAYLSFVSKQIESNRRHRVSHSCFIFVLCVVVVAIVSFCRSCRFTVLLCLVSSRLVDAYHEVK